MLSDIEFIAHEYITQKTPFDNGKIGNPFYDITNYDDYAEYERVLVSKGCFEHMNYNDALNAFANYMGEVGISPTSIILNKISLYTKRLINEGKISDCMEFITMFDCVDEYYLFRYELYKHIIGHLKHLRL